MRTNLLSPSTQQKRVDRARFLQGGASAGDSVSQAHGPVDLTALRKRLKEIRQRATVRLDESAAQLVATLAKRSPAVDIFCAPDANAAVGKIAAIAGETKLVSINRSGVVANELAPGLRARGFTIVESYFDQLHQVAGRFSFRWQLPELDDEWILESFQDFRKVGEPHCNRRDIVALLGVSAISADDASVFFLQHFDNIRALLTEAKEIVFLVGLDKILPTREEAAFQTKCAAVFGARETLMGLKGKSNGSVTPADRVPDVALVEQEQGIHLIVLDNGRRAILSGPYRELLHCIGCRACAEQCAMQRYFGGDTRMNPREYLHYSLSDVSASPDLCSLCNQCYSQCPAAIDIPLMVSKLRSERVRKGRPSLQQLMLGNPKALGKIGTAAAPLVNSALRTGVVRSLMEKTAKIDRRRIVPCYVPRMHGGAARYGPKTGQRKVAYFVGCWAQYNEPAVEEATVAVLQHSGVEVVCPDMRCCGVPQLANGLFEEARRSADLNVRALSNLIAGGYDVISTCPSCTLALKQKYPKLSTLGGAQEVAEHTFHFSEYLSMLHERGELKLDFEEVNRNIGFHVACHLKSQGLDDTVFRVLSLVPGLRVEYLDRGCCGMAGTFGFGCSRFAVSMEIGRPLFDAMQDPRLAQISTDCGTCKLQMEQGGERGVTHPMLILQEAYARRAN